MTANHEGAKIQQKLALGSAGRWNSEVSCNVLQELHRSQTWIKDIRIRDVGAGEQLEQAAYKQRFPGTHFAGQDDKALAPLHAVVESCQCLVVLLGEEQEVGIRRDLERILL